MSTSTDPSGQSIASRKPARRLESVTIRFAGDSGDGMQLAGMQFTDTSALLGNDVSTLPDFPAEIRAPAGTVAGVSGYQIQFSAHDIFTPGDEVDALVAMNPAALKTNLRLVKKGGIIIANQNSFEGPDLKKAGYESNPLDDGSLSGYRVIKVPVNVMNTEATKPAGITPKQADLCKNFFALGLVYWLYGRPLDATLQYIEKRIGKKNAQMAQANTLTLKAGYNYGETAELLPEHFEVPRAKLAPGTYRRINGNEAVALGMAAAASLAGKELFYASYPITPASTILESLAEMKHHRVTTLQAEDEICAMGAAIGAAFGGAMSATGTSGPGLALKMEALGLAVMTELPVLIVNVQRGGPSTGLPTKTEQADLLQAIWGRNGECPVPVVAAYSPSDCFQATIDAFFLAVHYMTPVLLLTDGYLANGSEPWLIPDVSKLPRITVTHPAGPNDSRGYMPYKRDEEGVRPWAVPGTPGLEHRVGGLEKADVTGAVSYDPGNHDRMIRLRDQKIANLTPIGQTCVWTGPQSGDVLLLGWGGTFGAIKVATMELQQAGMKVSHCHLRYLNPMPAELPRILKSFKTIIVPELNLGQLRTVLRARFLLECKSITKVRGQPFTITDIVEGVKAILAGREEYHLEEAGRGNGKGTPGEEGDGADAETEVDAAAGG